MNKKTEISDEAEAYLAQMSEAPLQEQFTTEQLIEAYRNLRESIKAREEALKAELAGDKKFLGEIETALSIVLDTAGGESVKTKAGTAAYRTSRSFKVVDRAALDDFVEQSGHKELYESRVTDSAVLALYESSGEVPPGLQMSEYRRVVVTAPRSR